MRRIWVGNRGAAVRRALIAVAVGVWLIGCNAAPASHDPASAMGHLNYLLDGTTCSAEAWVEGVIVPDVDGATAIRTDQGVVVQLFWVQPNTGDIEWGRRYRIGGSAATIDDRFVACAGASAVIPE